MEEKGILIESQAGFRRGRSTKDNIYILDHLIQREKKISKERKVYALFVDWKIAFDNIDRKRMWRVLEKKEINLRRRRRMEKIYEETEVMMRTKESYTEEFKTNKGVRQGCLLGTLLFNVCSGFG